MIERKNFPELEKEVKLFDRGWFESFAFWPKRKKVFKVIAKQVAPEEVLPFPPGFAMAKAKVFIYQVTEGKEELILQEEVPWSLFIGKEFLLLQVYLFSQSPGNKRSEVKEILEKFCFSYPEFTPPDKIWWSDEPLFF